MIELLLLNASYISENTSLESEPKNIKTIMGQISMETKEENPGISLGAEAVGGRREKASEVDSGDPVKVICSEISVYLDSRHDKKERIVKLSRDITIESKRIIFCLHRIRDEADPSREAILEEANTRLQEVRENLWRQVRSSFNNHHPDHILITFLRLPKR